MYTLDCVFTASFLNRIISYTYQVVFYSPKHSVIICWVNMTQIICFIYTFQEAATKKAKNVNSKYIFPCNILELAIKIIAMPHSSTLRWLIKSWQQTWKEMNKSYIHFSLQLFLKWNFQPHFFHYASLRSLFIHAFP